MMTVKEVIAFLQSLTPEQQERPLVVHKQGDIDCRIKHINISIGRNTIIINDEEWFKT